MGKLFILPLLFIPLGQLGQARERQKERRQYLMKFCLWKKEKL
jgi:hypothetical protein